MGTRSLEQITHEVITILKDLTSDWDIDAFWVKTVRNLCRALIRFVMRFSARRAETQAVEPTRRAGSTTRNVCSRAILFEAPS